MLNTTTSRLLKYAALFCLSPALVVAAPGSVNPAQAPADPGGAPHIVMIAADDEYRSEESLPMLGRILKQRHGFEVSVRFAIDPGTGLVHPAQQDNIPGLEVLDDADVMVIFARFRQLPQAQLEHLLRYAESGRPIVGLRTSTHLFKYRENSPVDDPEAFAERFNYAWPRALFGQGWLVHHGHFDDGKSPLTHVSTIPEQASHPILRGVYNFKAFSWLYHVEGDGDRLAGADNTRLLQGLALKSRVGVYLEPGLQHRYAGRRFPWTSPVAWTRSYETASGSHAPVFFTTLGHPYDFREPAMRKLVLNGIFWALGKASEIPENGLNADIVGSYNPPNSGMGAFRQDMHPDDWEQNN